MFYNYEISSGIIFKQQKTSKEELIKMVLNVQGAICDKVADNAEQIVGIALKRGPELVASILALLESKVTFLPIDLDLPKDRIKYMLNNAAVKKVIVSTETGALFEEYETINIDDINPVSIPKLDNNFQFSAVNDGVAYVLYTSGSTGKPKGVAVKRKGLKNFIDGVSDTIPIEKGKCIACFTSCSFDIFFLETVFAIYKGIDIVMADESEKDNPRKMANLIKDTGVDILQMTPSRLRMINMVDSEWECLKSVKIILVGGEKFSQDLLVSLQKIKDIEIYNMYGPTETTIWSLIANLSNSSFVHIGKPIKNTRVYLMDEQQKCIKQDTVGEICIAGDGLADGYVNNIGLTEKAFIKMNDEPYEVIYRTGDIGKYIDTGELLCLGRMDEQVKIHGHRVELDEIDAVIMQIEEIKCSVTCYIEETEQLVTFYCAQMENESIRSILVNYLPQYMIPGIYIRVEKIEYTISGKTNRKEMIEKYFLKEYINQDEKIYDKTNCKNNIQKKIADIVAKNLDIVDKLDYYTNLTEYGVDSIKMVSILVDIEAEFDIEFDDEKLMGKGVDNISMIIEYVKEKLR